jgi:uncharacterized protein YutE (UPF0331/DUF86 family)
MKYLVLITLVGILLVSLFDVFEADITNNTVAIALMLLLLALFSDLKEFNFWGLSGKKKEEELRKLVGSPVISEEQEEKPSAYKLKKAFKEDSIDQMGNLKDNFLAISFDIERMLRIIVRAIRRSTEETAVLNPESVLHYLEDEEFLTPEACDAIERLRDIRDLITDSSSKVSTETLEASLKLALPIHEALRDWLDESSKK